jgi:hypothetical protein
MIMKAFAYLALLSVAIVGCAFHSETVVQKPTPTAAVVVPDSPPPTTVYVPASD